MQWHFFLQKLSESWGHTQKQRVTSVLISVTSAIGLWREGAHYTGTEGQSDNLLPQFTFRDSKVTTPYLTSRTYSLLGEQGCGDIGKAAQIFDSAWGSNPGPLGCEPSVLLLHQRVPQN